MGQDLIKEVLAMLELDPSDCELIGGYSSNVFEVDRSEKFIVKILEKSVVNESSILAEMEWLDFLFSRGFMLLGRYVNLEKIIFNRLTMTTTSLVMRR